MKHIIVGTAGHIDHGKTSLIKALTGRDTDRLKEEQQRGITIDLGFTYFDLPDGRRVGIVDVPGHEKFIGNMIAGAAGMDLVLLVIAADEGMMPQTREHLGILEQLGIQRVIIVLSKCDLAEEEWILLAEEEIRAELQGSIYNASPLIRVSSAAGQGLRELTAMIGRMTEETEDKKIGSLPRLPVDRVFSLAGFGTIITGTLLSGQLRKNDELEMYPSRKICRVRNIQVHGEDRETCYAGQRVAVNLSDIKKTDIGRGCAAAPAGSLHETMLLDVRLNIMASSARTIVNRTRLRLYTGTGSVLCRAVLLDQEEVPPGGSGLAQLRLEEEIAVRAGDKFIVRLYSPVETLGGGTILDANPVKKKRFCPETVEELLKKESGSNQDLVSQVILEKSSTAISLTEISRLTGLSVEETAHETSELTERREVRRFNFREDSFFWHMEFERTAVSRLLKDLETFHKQNPFKPGLRKQEIRTRYFPGIRQNIFDLYIETAVQENIVKREQECISEPGFRVEENETFRNAEQTVMQVLQTAGFDFIPFTQIDMGLGSQEAEDVITYLVNHGRIVKVAPNYFTTAERVEQAAAIVQGHLKRDGLVTITQLRDDLKTSRKNVKLLLEYFDAARITKRSGPESERTAYK